MKCWTLVKAESENQTRKKGPTCKDKISKSALELLFSLSPKTFDFSLFKLQRILVLIFAFVFIFCF